MTIYHRPLATLEQPVQDSYFKITIVVLAFTAFWLMFYPLFRG